MYLETRIYKEPGFEHFVTQLMPINKNGVFFASQVYASYSILY